MSLIHTNSCSAPSNKHKGHDPNNRLAYQTLCSHMKWMPKIFCLNWNSFAPHRYCSDVLLPAIYARLFPGQDEMLSILFNQVSGLAGDFPDDSVQFPVELDWHLL